MFRNLSEPWDAGVFEFDIGIEPAGDGAMDDGLFLFVEQGDGFALCPDRPVKPVVGPVEETDDGGLLGGWWD